jgi:hypothetical protein
MKFKNIHITDTNFCRGSTLNNPRQYSPQGFEIKTTDLKKGVAYIYIQKCCSSNPLSKMDQNDKGVLPGIFVSRVDRVKI